MAVHSGKGAVFKGFYPRLRGQNFVTWPSPATREAGDVGFFKNLGHGHSERQQQKESNSEKEVGTAVEELGSETIFYFDDLLSH